MKKEQVKLLLELLFIFIISFLYGMFVYEVTMDEIWVYGFTHNIASGMIPYLDFNMVITPLYPFLGAVFLKLLGDSLISYYIFNSFFMVTIYYIIRKTNKLSAIITITFLIMVVMIPTYNILCFLLLFLVIYLEQRHKKNDYLIGFILGLLIITKQSIGIVCLLPSLYLIIKKQCSFKKRLIGVLIPVLFLILYLFINKAFFPFIDYAFLGLFDFRKNNIGFGFCFILTILMVCFLLYRFFIKKDKSICLIYILSFQIMNYPLFDMPHVLLSLVPVIFYLTKDIVLKNDYFIETILITILIVNLVRFGIYYMDNDYVWNNSLDVIKYKYVNNDTIKEINTVTSYLKLHPDTYILSYQAYLLKLEAGLNLNKYDLTNDGNMGYNGAIKYQNELVNTCSINICTFLIPDQDIDIGQTNLEIIAWVYNNFEKIDNISHYSIYSNRVMEDCLKK